MKVLIIEDEIIAARRLKRLLTELNFPIEIIGVIDTVVEAIQFLKEVDHDLIFMDIQLTDGSAFDILSEIEISRPIIFTTAYDQYVARAFRHHAFDYLLKPIQIHELATCISKFKENIRKYQKFNKVILSYANTCNILVRFGSRYHLISPHDIAYVYEREGLSIIVNHENFTIPINISLNKLLDNFNDEKLILLSDKFLVHLDTIREILELDRSQVEFVIYPPPPSKLIFNRDQVEHVIDALQKTSLGSKIIEL